jgi:iron complex transport system substrate-binding protein
VLRFVREFPARRIVCLTEETVETLYLLGEEDRIVGVSGYAVRPIRVRRETPRVSAFISADIPKILALDPDLVLTFSDLQAQIAAELIRAGIAVHAFNQRDIGGVLAMVRTTGALVGVPEKAENLACALERRLNDAAESSGGRPRLRVFFEEWDEPLISGIGWVSELIEIAGGDDVFPELRERGTRRAASSPLRRLSRQSLTSSSRPGAEKRSCRRGFTNGRDGRTYRQFGAEASSKSSRP